MFGAQITSACFSSCFDAWMILNTLRQFLLCKMYNTSSALELWTAGFGDTMKAPIIYDGLFHSEHGVKLVDMHNRDIVFYMLSSQILPNKQTSNLCGKYVRLGKLCINWNTLSPPLKNLSTESSTRKDMHISLLDYSVLCRSERKEVKLTERRRTTSSDNSSKHPVPCVFLLFCQKIYSCRDVWGVCIVFYRSRSLLGIQAIKVPQPARLLSNISTAFSQLHARFWPRQ